MTQLKETTKAEQAGLVLKRRLLIAGAMMLTVYAVGTAGFFVLGHGRWGLADCAYMTVITLTTTGYGEVLEGFSTVRFARLFTTLLLVSGTGIAVYFISILTTFLVEGEFLEFRRRRKMRDLINKMNNHIIVCGVGKTGQHVVEELVATHWSFVAIDTSPEKLQECESRALKNAALIVGDATDDKVLIEAGIKRAHGIVASLPDDKGNLFVVVTARGLNPRLRIVAKAVDTLAVSKLRSAGADSVVSVNTIGGLRMASEMIRPNVVTFLDKMMREKDKNLRFEELIIPKGSPLVNTKLAETDIREERNILIVAAKDPFSGEYTYSPGPQFLLRENMTLIILGETASVLRLRTSRRFTKPEEPVT